MRKFIFVCDGCDHSITTTDAKLPGYWAEVSINVTGYTNWRSGGSKEQNVDRLLCSDCQIALRERCDPTRWERAATEELQ